MADELNHIVDIPAIVPGTEIPDEAIVQEKAKEKIRAGAVINILLFFVFIAAGGILSLVLPQKKVSELEKRTLTQIPAFTWDTLFHGNYTRKMEDYYADNFPFRDNFVSATTLLKDKFGYRVNDVMVYNLNTGKGEIKPREDNSDTSFESDSVTEADSVPPGKPDTMENDAEIVKSVMIYKGRAIQMFGGSKAAGTNYAHMINNYHKALGSSVKIYCLVIPTPYDFYLPDKYKHIPEAEKKNIAVINSNLDSGVTGVDAYSEVAAHTSEYLYYYTDHHWTGRGAYYAYRGFCKSAGLAPYDLSQFQRKVIHHFMGSLYDLTRDPRLKANVDSVEYFKLPIATKTYIYNNPDVRTCFKSSLFAEMARGGNSYSVFLGGDFPLVRIESGIKNGKKLLVIKDSYGNALAPYFAMHYEEVYVVDYRYFNVNLLHFIRDHKITDMIFMHNTFVCNSRYTAQHENYLMRIKSIKTQNPLKKDSTATKTRQILAVPLKKDSLSKTK